MVIKLLGESGITNPVLMVLATHRSGPLSRDEILRRAYGEDPTPQSRNRFRVALARVRQRYPLTETDGLIELEFGKVITDHLKLSVAIQSLREEPDFSVELKGWRGIVESLAQRVEIDHPAMDAFRTEWSLEAAEALRCAIRAADQAHDPYLLQAAAQAGLVHFPYDLTFWSADLRASDFFGHGDSARVRYRFARERARAEGEILPVELETPDPPPFDEEQRRSLLAFFDRVLDTEPDLALQILASPSLRPELLRAPAALLPLLQEVLRHDLPPSEARERVQLRVVTGLALSQRDEEVIPAAEAFLATHPSPFRQSIAQLHLSFAYAEYGRFDEAYATIDASIALAEKYGQPLDAVLARGQRATFLLIQTQFAEAETALRENIEAQNALGNLPPEFNALTLRQNLALALAFQDRLPEAQALLLETENAAQEAHIEKLRATADTLLGWIAMRSGQHAEGLARFRRAFHRSYRSSPQELLSTYAFLSHGIRPFEPEIADHAASLSHALQQSTGKPPRPMQTLLIPQIPPNPTQNHAREIKAILQRLTQSERM